MSLFNQLVPKYYPEHSVFESVSSPSLSDYVKFLTTTKPDNGRPVLPDSYELCMSEAEERRQWAGGSMADAMRIITQGYEPEALKEIEFQTLEQQGALEIHRDMMGCVPDVGAYLAGAPDCMVDFSLTAPKKFASLYISYSYSWQIDADVVEYYSAKIYNLYNTLLAQNYEVEIIAYSVITLGSAKNDRMIVHSFPLAQFGYKISPQLLAAVFHPTFLRRIRVPYMFMNHSSDSAGVTRSIPAGLQLELNQNGAVVLKSLSEISGLIDQKLSKESKKKAIDDTISAALKQLADNN